MEIEVGDVQGVRLERTEASVDTGATYLVVARNVLAGLNCQPVERRPFTLADGRIVEYDVGVVSLKIDGRALPVLCVFGDDDREPLLGAVALEIFLLSADPVNKKLGPVTGRMIAQVPSEE